MFFLIFKRRIVHIIQERNLPTMKNKIKTFFINAVYYSSVVIAILIFVTTCLSLITDTSWRYLKMLDFPRIQYFIFGVIMLLIFIWITEKWKWYDILFAGMIAASMIFQGTYLINYTPLVNKAVPDASADAMGFKLMVYNVFMENEAYEDARKMLIKADPDLLVILETNKTWDKELKPVKEKYPFIIGTLNDVGYGMVIYSKIKLENTERYYLNNKNVPSYSFEIQPDNRPPIKIFSAHPPPPNSFEEMPDNVGDKEKALTIIGAKIKQSDQPSIVLGDLNDIAWGHTEELMDAGGKLHDVRVGRGFYNSFNAHSFWMRWPLDHVFVTSQFSLKNIQLLDNAGSDHYPIFVELSY